MERHRPGSAPLFRLEQLFQYERSLRRRAHCVIGVAFFPPDPEVAMRVREILQHKGEAVVTIAPHASIIEAMQALVRHNIGSLVVMDRGQLQGIITERDLLRAGAEDLEQLGRACVSELMTRDVITASADAPIDGIMHVMSERRIRHLPIVEAGVLHGMISIGDVINALRQSTEAENQYLHAYITSTPL